jgi:cyclopropane fatty-acyl-phospholipid synthase-like methyltransferase
MEISDEAQQLFAAAGEAGERINLLLEDYQNLQGSFNKLVSIEMFEAVGLDYYDAFFSEARAKDLEVGLKMAPKASLKQRILLFV